MYTMQIKAVLRVQENISQYIILTCHTFTIHWPNNTSNSSIYLDMTFTMQFYIASIHLVLIGSMAILAIFFRLMEDEDLCSTS